MAKSEDAKARIIEATIKVASVKGFANTRTAEIAREAGVSEALIYKYFPSKNELFAVIIQDNFRRIKAGVEPIIAAADLNATGKITALVNFHFQFFMQEQNIVQLVLGHSDRKNIDLEKVFDNGFKPYVQLVAGIVDEGIKNREFRRMNPEVAAMAILGSMQFILINQLLGNGHLDLSLCRQELTEYILTGLKIDQWGK